MKEMLRLFGYVMLLRTPSDVVVTLVVRAAEPDRNEAVAEGVSECDVVGAVDGTIQRAGR